MNLVIQGVDPLHAGSQIYILEKPIIADIEKDLIVHIDVERSVTQNAGSGPADVTQRDEVRIPRWKMDAGCWQEFPKGEPAEKRRDAPRTSFASRMPRQHCKRFWRAYFGLKH
jgi:hypothetical protein